jgi:DUF438 domain-containing protein
VSTRTEAKEAVKELLKAIHRGADPRELREKFRDILFKISPFEIPIIEQELVREGIPVSEILKLCDLHVELFREVLMTRELQGVPRGHPLDLLLRENEWIAKRAEALGIYAQALVRARSPEERRNYVVAIRALIGGLKEIRLHYRKIQMAIFPYLERRGIIAVPRVLWAREDQVIVKLRKVAMELEKIPENLGDEEVLKISSELLELSREINELVFRENKVLFPAIWALLSESEWAAIAEVGEKLGYIVEVEEGEWRPSAKPIYPHELQAVVTREQIERLPPELKSIVESRGLRPDTYIVKREGDIELETGFLRPEEVEGIFRALPLEITYADVNDRVRFFSESSLVRGFPRAKTIIGRNLLFCHPPRLENYVKINVEALKRGDFKYREFWTKMGDRILRVIIARVEDREGRLLGVLEIVEDMTDIINNPEEVKKKIVVL